MSKIIFPKFKLTDYKGVLIDIDNTLYPYEPAHNNAIYACFIKYKKILNQDLSFEEFYQKYKEKRTTVRKSLFSQGACRSRLLAFQSLFEEMYFFQSYNYALKFEEIYWDTFLKHMKCSQDAYQFLHYCFKKNIRVCAISDMQAKVQIQKLQVLGVDKFINYLVTSEEIGSEKPAPLNFKKGLLKLNLKANEVVMIGDSLEKDILGAKTLGIKAYLIEVKND